MSRLPRLLAFVFLLALLAGCGNKGDLVKPPPADAPAASSTPG